MSRFIPLLSAVSEVVCAIIAQDAVSLDTVCGGSDFRFILLKRLALLLRARNRGQFGTMLPARNSITLFASAFSQVNFLKNRPISYSLLQEIVSNCRPRALLKLRCQKLWLVSPPQSIPVILSPPPLGFLGQCLQMLVFSNPILRLVRPVSWIRATLERNMIRFCPIRHRVIFQ